MKKAADEEKLRAPRSSKDEMPPPASLQGWSLVLFILLCLCSDRPIKFRILGI